MIFVYRFWLAISAIFGVPSTFHVAVMRCYDFLDFNFSGFEFLYARVTGEFNFWSSKVCEGGESRVCKLTFGPPQFLFEIYDLGTQTYFWSTFKLIENSLSVQFELLKVDQNFY